MADSDVSKSSGDDSDDFDFLSSDDESSKDQVKSVKTKKTANGLKKPIISESESDDELTEDEGGDADRSKKRKKRVRRDSLEREIFHKDFLDIDGESEKSTVAKKPKIDGEATRKSVEITVSSPSKIDNSPLKENLELFENTKIPKPANLEAVFEKRALAFEHNPPAGSSISSSSTTTSAGPSFSGQKLKPILIEEEGWITLSSDSDSEVSAATSGTNPSTIPNRKKMLSEEELQKETKEAQKAEKQRIERLEKKAQQLSQIMSQRLSQDPDKSETLVLDFDKDKKTIEVHPKLVKFLKKHQVDGVKFMYDTCFGSVSDKEVTASGCILAHCMGLGKTLQLITLIHTLISYPQLKTKRILVICPKSTIMNWKDEFLHWLDGIDTKNLKIDYLGDTMKIQERVNLLKKWHTSSRPGVFLINYEAFRNLVNYSGSHGLKAKIPLPASVVQRLQEDITRCLLSPGPDLVVCDEGHLIKNLASKITKAITKIETRRRIILTGTPVQNNLNEYYAMVDWIKPALLGTVKEFNNLYVNPIKDGQHVDSTPQLIKKMKQRSLILYKNLSKFVQRKEATVLREFLPDKHEYCIFVPLTKVQEKLYRYFLDRNKMCSENRGKSMLCDYTALRKIWTHPQVLQNAYDRAIKGELKFDTVADAKKRKSKNQVDEDENEEPDDLLDHADGAMGVKNNWWSHLITLGDQQTLFSSNKLILLFNILRMCQERGEKVLVFSAFVAVLNIVEHFMREIHKTHEQLKNTGTLNAAAESMGLTEFLSMWKEGLDYYRLDGSTKRDVRHEMVKQFNNRANKRLRCFLISAKAGGQGINLTGANRCIILDTSWNPSSDQQNIFRIYRLGQPKTCFVYR